MFRTKKLILVTALFLLLSLLISWQYFTQGISKGIQEDIQKGNQVVLFFSASWCGSCKKQKPLLEEVKKEFPDIHFYDVGSNLDKISKKILFKRYEIMGVPTILVFKEAKEYQRLAGVHSTDELRAAFSNPD